MVLKPYQILLCGYIFSDRAWARQEILHLGACKFAFWEQDCTAFW